ncbi:protein FAM104A [Pimephales promelas]|uniref:protein FAM104A n=1 Tax=Pimephales promelas TaxID=90988 RepID=UPI0019559E25|nr:protein FAM104A [Pimephales promelas]KAG1930019.1 hypothetical protein F2P79_022610 [Pimephales promelas]
MLTENRKRQRADEDAQMPQAKRLSSSLQSPETGRESWESESSSSESWISSPDQSATGSNSGPDLIGPISPISASKQSGHMDPLSYQHINRVLREAHFHSLQSRAQAKHR